MIIKITIYFNNKNNFIIRFKINFLIKITQTITFSIAIETNQQILTDQTRINSFGKAFVNQ
jgi:hypothetical protein